MNKTSVTSWAASRDAVVRFTSWTTKSWFVGVEFLADEGTDCVIYSFELAQWRALGLTYLVFTERLLRVDSTLTDKAVVGVVAFYEWLKYQVKTLQTPVRMSRPNNQHADCFSPRPINWLKSGYDFSPARLPGAHYSTADLRGVWASQNSSGVVNEKPDKLILYNKLK